MATLVGHLQQALAHTRDLAKGLYPILSDGGLVAALNELALTVRKLFAVHVTVESQPGVDISDEAVTVHLYRIVQEAVNNVPSVTAGRRASPSACSGGMARSRSR
ncbi:MAG: hypothetical protein M0C28_45700 [Candidatus Moduliflexus flocculans]|nr:hypothetical protein [Candidatus Moduliflexus flocculans]